MTILDRPPELASSMQRDSSSSGVASAGSPYDYDNLNLSSSSPSCKPGLFSSIKDWRGRFPEGHFDGFKEKAVIAIPAGGKARRVVVRRVGTCNYDFIFITFDDHDWTSEEWHGDATWIEQPQGAATSWGLAKRFLTPDRVAPYSHVCFWDDDLGVGPEFDGDVFLQWMQAFDMGIVQPMIGRNAHAAYEGTSAGDRPHDNFVHEIEHVEVMAPCYSRRYWSDCLWPLLNPDHSSGWGVDIYLHGVRCAPEHQHSVRLPLDHVDMKSHRANPAVEERSNRELDEVRELVESRGIMRSEGGRKYRSYSVHVDEKCRLELSNATLIEGLVPWKERIEAWERKQAEKEERMKKATAAQ